MLKLTLKAEGPIASGKTRLLNKILRLLEDDDEFKIEGFPGEGYVRVRYTMNSETKEVRLSIR